MHSNQQKVTLIIAVSFLILFPSISLAGPLPDTGQTKCYNDTQEITCPSPGQSFYGQDAQYGTNLQSYTKLDANGNNLPDEATEWAMIRDNITGLIWENKTDDESIHDKDNGYNWYDAQDVFIATLNSTQFGGYSDWRLPTVKELMSIVNNGTYSPSINTTFFPYTEYYYWSFTAYIGFPAYAWVVDFNNGSPHYYSYGYYGHFVRAVRGGQSSNNFIDNGDGTITDTDTGLMWQKDTAPGAYTWQQALSYCENLTLAEHNDWRLPNRNELQSLIDYSRYNPSINTTFFPNTGNRYWSSTTLALNAPGALIVVFVGGFVSGDYKSERICVRAVRKSYTIPDTGQTKCYDAYGYEINPCPSPGQSFYGQDAQYSCNPHSYTMLAGGIMVKDNVTGLIWESKTDDNSIHDKNNTYNWYDAQDVLIATLNSQNFGGYSDWRLPTVKELSTIVDSSIPYPGPSINTTYFPNTVSSVYWSSTTNAYDPYYAWVVCFADGGVSYTGDGNKSGRYNYVRAVRGGQSSNNFIDNGDGTVTDTDTGLMWQKDTAPGTYTWQQALSYCEDLIFPAGGYSDWRLPNRNELQSIVDYSRYNPSIDPIFNAVSSWYWSSTTGASSPFNAWVVYFYYGYFNCYYKSYYDYYVRAVRGGQCGEFDSVINALDGLRDAAELSIDHMVDLLAGTDQEGGGIPEAIFTIRPKLDEAKLKLFIGTTMFALGILTKGPDIAGLAAQYGLNASDLQYLKTISTPLKAAGLIFNYVNFGEDWYNWFNTHENLLKYGTESNIRTAMRNYLETGTNPFLDSLGNTLPTCGTSGVKTHIHEKFEAYKETLGSELPENYPVSVVVNKINFLKEKITDAGSHETLLYAANCDDPQYDFILGNPVIVAETLKSEIDHYTTSKTVNEVLFWSGVGTGAALMAKSAGIVLTGGLSVPIQGLITAGYFGSAIISPISTLISWGIEKSIGEDIRQLIQSGTNEICNIRAVSVDMLTYLQDLEATGWSPVGIDNSQIQITSFMMEDVQLPYGKNTASVSGSIQVTNNGPDTVPVTAYVKIHRVMSVNGNKDNFPIMFAKSDTYDLPKNSCASLNINPTTLVGSDILEADRYKGEAYIIAGPSIIAKQIGPVTDEFNVCSSYLLCPTERYTYSQGSSSLGAGEEWWKEFTPVIEPFKEIYYSDVEVYYQDSDFDLHVYDTSGNHVGVNYGTGQVDLEIPGAIYHGPQYNPEVIRLPQPTGQTYDIRVVAIQTLGEESFEVVASNIPLRPAILTVAPTSIQSNFIIDEIPHVPIIVSLKEIGGQNELTDISVSSTDLIGPNGHTINSENVTFDLISNAISPGGAIDCTINLDIPPDLSEGKYTGEITFDSSANSIVAPITLNLMELDSDSDGINFAFDNCPFHANPEQIDTDEDDIGDACEAYKGDVNNDAAKNVCDVQLIINIFLEVPPQPTDRQFWGADCDNDHDITVADVQIAINKILEQ